MSIYRNIVANYLGRAYSIVAIYLFIPFYVKILGVEAYGIIAFYTVLLTLTGLADIGLSSTFSREAAGHSDGKRLLTLLSTIERILYVSVSIFALAIFVGAGTIAAHWLNPQGSLDVQIVTWSLRFMALMVVAHLGFSLYLAGLLGLQKQVSANLIQSLFITIRSLLVIIPILWHPSLTLFFGWQLIATIIFALATRITLIKAIGFQSFALARFDYSAVKPHLTFAGGMMAISVISSINTQIDKLLVSNMFSLTELGYYNLASSLAQVPVALATPIAVALYPHLTAYIAKEDLVQKQNAYEKYGQWITFIASLGALGIALFAPELLILWLQDSHLTPMITDLSVKLVIGSLFLCLQMSSYYLCLAHGQSRLIVILVSTTLLLSVPLTLIFVRKLGLVGVTLPWIILNLMNFWILTIVINRRFYVGTYLSWFARVIGFPMAAALIPLLGARFISNALKSSPIWTCGIAGIFTGVAFSTFFALPYIRPALRSLAR